MSLTTPAQDDLLEIAAAALEEGNPETTLQLCRELLETWPDHDDARLLEAEALRDLRDAVEAEQSYRRLLARRPDHADGWAGMGRALLDQGRFGEASTCFARALRHTSGHAEAHHGRAMLREFRGDLAGASRDHARAWQASSRFPPPAPLDVEAVRALVDEAAGLLDDPHAQAWLDTIPIVLEDFPSSDTCEAYEPPASPVDLLGHLAAPLGDGIVGARFTGFTPSLVLFVRNLERHAWDRERLVTVLAETVLSQAQAWLAQTSIEA